MSINIKIEKSGRRYYILGDTYPIKDRLRNAGCNWDPDRKAWWTGKQDVADRLTKEGANSESGDTEIGDIEVVGRATYKGKPYYVVWHGVTRKGEYAAKLCFRDGSKQFWAREIDALQITKEYRQPKSLQELQEWAKAAQSGELETCAECGRTGRGMKPLPDSSGIIAPVCGSCAARTTQYERSYC